MKIAVAGKGGSGKTTIAGTLARALSQRDLRVLAIDGDTNPNLAISAGIPRDTFPQILPLPSTLLQRVTDAEGRSKPVLTMTLDQIERQFGVAVNANLMLLEMGRVDHAGAG